MSEPIHNESHIGGIHRSNVDGAEASIMQFPFHGTCRNCNHLHHGNVISFSTNQESHSRVSCERCHHVMFGLGRNSTQTTLASVSTASATNTLPVRGPGSYSDLQACGDDINDANPSDQSSDAPRDTDSAKGACSRQKTGQLNPNGSPPRPITNQPNDTTITMGNAVSPSGDNVDREERIPALETQNREQQIQQATINQPHNSRAKVKRMIDFVKYRLLKRSQRPEKPVSRGEATDLTNTENPAILTNSQIIEESPQVKLSQDSAQSPHSEQIHESDNRTLEPAPAEPDETTLSNENASRLKKERLRVKRREATLRKRQLRARRCYCNENCHCFRNAGRATPTSHGSVHASIVPHYPLGESFIRDPDPSPAASEANPRSNSPERHVAFAGTQFDSSSRLSSGPGTSLAIDAYIRRRPSGISSSTRTSQATTAIDSRSSEARAASLSSPRTMSLPGPHELVLVVENSRPAVLESLRNFRIFDRPAQQNPNRSAVDAELSQQDPEPQSSLSSLSEEGVGIELPPHASATSLSHLPDPSDVQTDNDASPLPSSSPTTGQGSNVRTPQIRTAEDVPSPPPQPGPDEVSLALQALSEEEGCQSTEVTDFGAAV